MNYLRAFVIVACMILTATVTYFVSRDDEPPECPVSYNELEQFQDKVSQNRERAYLSVVEPAARRAQHPEEPQATEIYDVVSAIGNARQFNLFPSEVEALHTADTAYRNAVRVLSELGLINCANVEVCSVYGNAQTNVENMILPEDVKRAAKAADQPRALVKADVDASAPVEPSN